MRDEELINDDIPYTIPEDPETLKDEELHDLLDQQSTTGSAGDSERVSPSKTAPGGKNDMHVMEVVNRVLLTEALARMEGHILFSSELRSDIEDHTLFDRFSKMLAYTKPVVIIETVFPFFEDVIATMITSQSGYPLNLVKPNIHSNVDGKLNQVRSLNDKQLLTLPIHSYRLGGNDELLSHEIALSDSAILIGCHSINDVPEPLRRITDMILHIPSINEFSFGTIFNELYGHFPPENQMKDIYRWVNQVLPTDFQQPLRLELPLNRIIPYIRQRVEKRMSSVESEEGPGLDDLYGLGEAKHVARDLLADVEAATRGELSWDRVDKGMLMVGPPGTGKTTLARAIAKESGLKFINASASEWQMVDHLGHHLTNIRRDFALARRYAPSILFIDELDSIGNRQQFSGKNAAYSTQVVNTLLSEIQGFEEEGKVIVIGASNYLENIDPALRRAGRLDQIVQVSYPNIKALTNIYSFYLSPLLEDDSDLEEDTFFKELAQLSFGCTGADVEEYVRGALRRARKERRKIQKSDLIDEITGKSRSGTGTLRMNRDEMYRVAVHEGGHALMKILSSTQGLDISMVSIVPRSDGSLGFVASIPDERAMRTRKEYHELLEVFLGGRAAEEVIFGKEQISSGAGGSKQSDLAKATTLAQRMITRYGLGEDTSLLWSEEPAPEDLDKVRQMLENTYATVLDKLRNEKEKLKQIAELLVEEQEIEGRELLEEVLAAKT